MNKEGATAGMVAGILIMLYYMLRFKFDMFGGGNSSDWWLGISPEGFGTVAMLLNFIVSLSVSALFKDPPIEVQEIVENIRLPKNAGRANSH